MSEIYKRLYRVRRAAVRGKEVTVPSDVKLEPGDMLIAFYDGFVLCVPMGTQVDEALLRRAITERTDLRNEESVGKRLPDTSEAESG